MYRISKPGKLKTVTLRRVASCKQNQKANASEDSEQLAVALGHAHQLSVSRQTHCTMKKSQQRSVSVQSRRRNARHALDSVRLPVTTFPAIDWAPAQLVVLITRRLRCRPCLLPSARTAADMLLVDNSSTKADWR